MRGGGGGGRCGEAEREVMTGVEAEVGRPGPGLGAQDSGVGVGRPPELTSPESRTPHAPSQVRNGESAARAAMPRGTDAAPRTEGLGGQRQRWWGG